MSSRKFNGLIHNIQAIIIIIIICLIFFLPFNLRKNTIYR